MPEPERARPTLHEALSAEEFQRWYWLKDELVSFARDLGIGVSGGKELLAARIAARLDGREFAEPGVRKRAGGRQLAGPLSADTVIPVGQRCSQVVREWMRDQVGERFHFDAEMRAFFAASDGIGTMQDALDHWRSTREQGERRIEAQFEYNRFTRAWHAEHPDGERAELLVAWREYRACPVDERGRASLHPRIDPGPQETRGS